MSLLSVRSSQVRLDRLPMEGGMPPLKLLEFRDLQRIEMEGGQLCTESMEDENIK